MKHYETCLNICSWNVGGMKTNNQDKTMEKDFLEQVKNYDIVLLTETHVGYNNILNIDNFHYFPVCRQKSSNKRYFGGLGIFIKTNIRKGVTILQNSSTEFQWIKLKKDFFNFKNDIFVCLTYIAPQSSQYNNRLDYDILELIKKDIIEKYGKQGDIIITGDFNARTGCDQDYIPGDCTSHIPVDRTSYRVDDAVKDRYSCDLTIDTRGKELLELCISNQLRILNGRTCGDSSGKFTCFNYAGNSVVDYFIASERL